MDRKFIVSGIQLQDGVESMSRVLSTAFFKAGAYVVRDPDYLSTIYGGRAGTSFYQVRVSDQKLWCSGDEVADALVVLELGRKKGELPTAAKNYLEKIGHGGLLIYDSTFVGAVPDGHFRVIPVPAYEIAKKLFPGEAEPKIGKIRNTVLIGALFELFGFDGTGEASRAAFEKQFAKKGGVAEQNLRALEAGRAYAAEHSEWPRAHPPLAFEKPASQHLFLTGNDAMCIASLASGMGLYTGYPITPASPILELLEKNFLKFNGIPIQSEDEVAAAAAVFGASAAGVPSWTATSGPGRALMAEMVSHAGIAEIPLPIVDVQRAGPSTGMPTKTAQEDLLFAIFGHHGEIPLAVLAPGDVTECFEAMARGLYLAWKYRMPVHILTSLEIGEGWATAEPFDLDVAGRYPLFELMRRNRQPLENHKPYEITGDGVTPFAIPGQKTYRIVYTGVEHDEGGFVSTNRAVRVAMMKKRFKKLEEFLREDFRPPEVIGPVNPDIALVGWGSSKGAIREARERLEERGVAASAVHFTDLWPMPAKIAAAVGRMAPKLMTVEGNATGQLAMLLRMKASEENVALPKAKLVSLLRYDGRPLEPQKIVNRALAEVNRG